MSATFEAHAAIGPERRVVPILAADRWGRPGAYSVTEAVQFDPSIRQRVAKVFPATDDLATTSSYAGLIGNVERKLSDIGRIR